MAKTHAWRRLLRLADWPSLRRTIMQNTQQYPLKSMKMPKADKSHVIRLNEYPDEAEQLANIHEDIAAPGGEKETHP